MRQQLRQLSGDTAIYGITTIIQRFLSFLLVPFYTYKLSEAEIGIQAIVFAYIAFAMILTNAGMEAAYFKYESVAETADDKRRVYWSAITVNWLAALTFSGAVLIAPDLFNRITLLDLSPPHLHLLRMAAAIIFFDSASAISLASLRMERRPRVFGAIKVAAIVVNVVLNIWLVGVLEMRLEGVFIAGVVQSFVQFALTLIFLVRKLPVTVDRPLVRELLSFGLPTIASGISAIALQVIDRPIMNVLVDEAATGLYQTGFRLGIPMMLFVSMFEFAWRPFFLQQASKPNARQLYARIFTYFNLAAAVLFLGISFFIVNLATARIPFVDAALIAPNFWSSLTIVPIVLAAYIFNGWYTNFIVGIYIEKKTKALPWITGLGGAAKAGLCFLMIPAMGILGGAWATLAAYLVMALTLYVYVQRRYTIAYEWGRVMKIAVGAIGIWIANTLLLDFYDRSLQAALIRLGLLAAFPLWLFVTGFFEREERRELARFLPFLRRSEQP